MVPQQSIPLSVGVGRRQSHVDAIHEASQEQISSQQFVAPGVAIGFFQPSRCWLLHVVTETIRGIRQDNLKQYESTWSARTVDVLDVMSSGDIWLSLFVFRLVVLAAGRADPVADAGGHFLDKSRNPLPVLFS